MDQSITHQLLHDSFWAAPTALVAGATTSLHCVAMCGPLACAAAGSGGRNIAAWQLGRLVGYSATGALLGTLGSGLARALQPLQTVFPWIVIVGLVITALGLGKHRWVVQPWARVSARLMPHALKAPAGARPLLVGAVTPLLPCGVLWGLFLAAAASGSVADGALLAASFAIGSAPALAFAQLNTGWLSRVPWARRGLSVALPLAAAAVLVWRTGSIPSNGAAAPHCHHHAAQVSG